MPIYMDRHDLPGVTAKDVADAHQQDLKIQHIYGCKALTYWFDEDRQTAFCLIEAPNKEAVSEMHEKAHGLVPHQVIEVNDQIVESFLGRIKDPDTVQSDNAYLQEPALRVLVAVQAKVKLNSDSENTNWQKQLFNFENNKSVNYLLSEYEGRQAVSNKKLLIYSFMSANQAIRFALSLKQNLHDSINENERKLLLKIGISAGSPIDNDDDFFRRTIQEAVNLSLVSNNNIIIVSRSVSENFSDEELLKKSDKEGLKILLNQEEELIHQLLTKIELNKKKKRISLDEFALELGVSKSKLYRQLMKITHLPPNTLIKELRLAYALDLIEQQEKTIAEIAYETGFSSPSYFSKCFKDEYGLLPSSYYAS